MVSHSAHPSLALCLQLGGWHSLNCARRTSTALSCAFREHGD